MVLSVLLEIRINPLILDVTLANVCKNESIDPPTLEVLSTYSFVDALRVELLNLNISDPGSDSVCELVSVRYSKVAPPKLPSAP